MLIETVGYADPHVQALVERVQAEYVVRYGGPDQTPVDPAQFAAPDGVFLLARVGQRHCRLRRVPPARRHRV